MILSWWLLVSANVAACHMLRVFIANYIGNRTVGPCMPQGREHVCRIFNGQGDVEAILIFVNTGRYLNSRAAQCYLGKVLTEPWSQVFRLDCWHGEVSGAL